MRRHRAGPTYAFTTVVARRSYSRYSRSSRCDAVTCSPERAQRARETRPRGPGCGSRAAGRSPPPARRSRRTAATARRTARRPSATARRGRRRSTRSAHADPARGRHQRLGSSRLERVELGPRLAADLEHVLEAARGEQHDARAAALEQRVGRHGRAVVQPRRGRRRPAGASPSRDGARRVVGRRAQLQHAQAAARQRDEVGEGAAGVDPDDDRSARSGVGRRGLGLAFFLRLGSCRRSAWTRTSPRTRPTSLAGLARCWTALAGLLRRVLCRRSCPARA